MKPLRPLAALAAALVLTGCAGTPAPEPEPTPEPGKYAEAVHAEFPAYSRADARTLGDKLCETLGQDNAAEVLGRVEVEGIARHTELAALYLCPARLETFYALGL